MRLERLYRRRVPADQVITPELTRACTELSHELRREIGLVITRRGTIEQVIVGNGRELMLSDASRYRAGHRFLRGVRLIHTHLHNGPLTQHNLTTLALLRLDHVEAAEAGGAPLTAGSAVIRPLKPGWADC